MELSEDQKSEVGRMIIEGVSPEGIQAVMDAWVKARLEQDVKYDLRVEYGFTPIDETKTIEGSLVEVRVPTHIIHWQNDMLMTFDQFGEQMPEYQGVYEETINKIPPEYHHLIERQQWSGTIVTGTAWRGQ